MVAFAALAIAAPPSSFQLAREDGRGWVSPGSFQQRPSVFLFWDTECAPCLQELTHLESLEVAFPHAVFVAVSLSPREDTRRVLARISLPQRVFRARAPSNPRGLLNELGNRSGALPFSAFFSGTGSLCGQRLGLLDTEALSAAQSSCP